MWRANARGRTGGRAAARGRTDGSRLARPRRVGARRGPAPASVVPWCGASCGAQCGAHALGRRTGRWSLDGMCGVGGLRSGREQHARAPPRPLEGCCRAPRFEEERAPERHERALEGRGGVHSGCARGTLRGRGPAFLRRPLSGVRASAGCRGKPPMARATSRCAKKNDASIPLHTLQALRALARIKVPGGASDFLIFFGVRKERKKISNLSTPFSQKKCARCARCAVPFLPPPSSRELHPPITSPHYQLPPEALVLLFSS